MYVSKIHTIIRANVFIGLTWKEIRVHCANKLRYLFFFTAGAEISCRRRFSALQFWAFYEHQPPRTPTWSIRRRHQRVQRTRRLMNRRPSGRPLPLVTTTSWKERYLELRRRRHLLATTVCSRQRLQLPSTASQSNQLNQHQYQWPLPVPPSHQCTRIRQQHSSTTRSMKYSNRRWRHQMSLRLAVTSPISPSSTTTSTNARTLLWIRRVWVYSG